MNRRYQRGTRALVGFSGGSHLARPPQVLEEPDIKPDVGTVLDVFYRDFGNSESGTTSIAVAIVEAPAAAVNIIVLAAEAAPNIPSGWTLTVGPTGDAGSTGQAMYVLEKAADGATTVNVTWPSTTIVQAYISLYTQNATVAARDTDDLAGVTTFTEDFDRVDPDEPTVALFAMLYTGIGHPTLPAGWARIIGVGTPPAEAGISVWRYLGDPPSSTWVQNYTPPGPDTSGTHQEFYAWVYWELGP